MASARPLARIDHADASALAQLAGVSTALVRPTRRRAATVPPIKTDLTMTFERAGLSGHVGVGGADAGWFDYRGGRRIDAAAPLLDATLPLRFDVDDQRLIVDDGRLIISAGGSDLAFEPADN